LGAVPLLLGAISIATAPGVTLLVIREYKARGPLTETLLAVVAINNILCLVVFRLCFGFYNLMEGEMFWSVTFMLFKELVLAALIGGAVAAIITFWEQKIDDLSELLLVIIGGLLLAIGLVISVADIYPDLGQTIGAVIFSSVIIYEGIGPFLTEMAVARAGEIHLQE